MRRHRIHHLGVSKTGLPRQQMHHDCDGNRQQQNRRNSNKGANALPSPFVAVGFQNPVAEFLLVHDNDPSGYGLALQSLTPCESGADNG